MCIVLVSQYAFLIEDRCQLLVIPRWLDESKSVRNLSEMKKVEKVQDIEHFPTFLAG